MIKNRLLVSGLGGFAGSHILEHFLINTDWEIIGIDSWRHKGCPERIEEILKNHPEWVTRVTLITHDLNAPLTERTQKRIGIVDYIINCAAESHVDTSILEPVPFVLNNVNIALNMLELARNCKPKVFIQISTDEVYGPAPKGVNHKEWSAIIPSNPYSASKACQEAIATSYWRTFGVPLIITNTMNMFGEMQDTEKYLAKAIRIINAGETLTVHGTPDSIGSRFYLHARNHADALLFLLIKTVPAMFGDENIDRPDRYHIVGDMELSNLDIANSIAGYMKKTLHYEFEDFHATRPGHDKRYALDGTKIKKLGWKAPRELFDSLKNYIKWTLNNSSWL